MLHALYVCSLFVLGYVVYLLILWRVLRSLVNRGTQMPQEHETGDDVAPHLRTASLLDGRDDYTPPFVRPYRFAVGFPDEDDEVDDCEQ